MANIMVPSQDFLLKIKDPRTFFSSIFDFHSHLHITKTQTEYYYQYSIKGTNIMPSWKTGNECESTGLEGNDFSHPEQYLNLASERIKSDLSQKLNAVLFAPIQFGENSEYLEQLLVRYQPLGIKLHPLQNFAIEHRQLDPYMNIIAHRKLPVYVHTDWVPSTEFKQNRGTLWKTFGKLAQMYPDIIFIMGHAGNNDSWVNIHKLLQKNENTYVETSMAPSPGEIEKVVRRVGPERVLFGSNFPFCDPAVEITKIAVMEQVSPEEKQQIMEKNALRLLKRDLMSTEASRR